MGEVIYAHFGTEREWKKTHEKTAQSLVEIGALFGDDAALMRAKADRLYQVLRQMVEGIPPANARVTLPAALPAAQVKLLREEIRKGVLDAMELVVMHCVQTMMDSIFDLCTSKLADRVN